ncbi:MAG: hypothetical protein JWN79_2061 [Gemmatimonadetes bacterium]|nr:hypothetical protein [Gemmatimonadota bacterium]
MLALAPLALHDAPLDTGERFALDLLLDLSCVLRTNMPRPDADDVQLRIVGSAASDALGVGALRGDEWLLVGDGEVLLDRRALAVVRDVAGGVAEQRSGAVDRFGRIPASENALVREGGDLERDPVVSAFARRLAAAVARAAGRRRALFIAPWPDGRRWAAALTHDLDVVEWWPAFTALRLAELARKGELRRALAVVRAAIATGGRDVVWRGVDEVLRTERAHGVRSSWFILTGTPTLATARAGDLTYRPEGALARRILGAIADEGHEIGLHGSFATSDDPAQFALQRARLAALASTEAAGVRQHYLRLHAATTPAEMARAGFAYDSTAGFPDRNGFRLGVADVVPCWNAAHDAVLPLDEAPFCWMDRALSKYRGIEAPDAWIDDALVLADRCRAVQGMFVGIWHPNLTPALGFPGAPAAYARLVAGIVELGAHVAPLGELVAWRRMRRRVRATSVGPDGRISLNETDPAIVLVPAAEALANG